MTKLIVLLCFVYVTAQYEGDHCSKGGEPGICTGLANCQAAIDDIRNKKNPQICTFNGQDPIVCCAIQAPTTVRPPVATTSANKVTSTTEYIPPVYEYSENGADAECEPIPAKTSPKTGRKAWDMCVEYQEKLVYPCERGVALTGEMSRGNHCKHGTSELVVGGVDASEAEFPHMVLLGFGENLASVQWLCGGTLISDRFILSAGHCTSSRDFGNVTYVVLGNLKRSDHIDPSRRYRIKTIIKHPNYKAPKKYHDIALLETDTIMKLDQFAIPACLDIGNTDNDHKAIATGWGATQYRGDNADTLQKVTLQKFTHEECSEKFIATRLMVNGFDSNTQICYGDKTKSKDTCQGDSGGPLQVRNNKIECMYTIIGVTSFGKACGFIGEPGMYTRVSTYTPWIESIVWP